MKQMKLMVGVCFGLICVPGFCVPAPAQVYSNSIIGYFNQVLYPGDNLIANQWSNSNNTLNAIFNQSIPEGTGFTKWDPATARFQPISTYDPTRGWSINYALNYGEGGLLHAASAFTNTFVGTAWPGYNFTGPYNPPLVTSYGLLLLACYAPIGSANFYDVVGREPQTGESVSFLNAGAQTSTLTTFANGAWSNGNPLLNVGQAAFFNLKPVPEPAVLSMLGLGPVLFAAVRWKRKP